MRNRASVHRRSSQSSPSQPWPELFGLETEDLICGLQQSGEKVLLQTDSALLHSRWAVTFGCASPG